MDYNWPRTVLRRCVFVLVICILSVVYFLLMTGKIGGPKSTDAFREAFDREIPHSVSDIRYEYYRHLKGYGYYLSFDISPEDLASLISQDDAEPLFVDGFDASDHWSAKRKFEQMHDGKLPDLELASFIKEGSPGKIREIVVEPVSRRVFCFYLVDSDIN